MKNIVQWIRGEQQARAQAAQLIGAKSEEIAFVRSTSHGLGLLAEGLPWTEGDEVAVCLQEEFPANVYPWMHLANRGVRLRDIPSRDGGVVVDEVAKVLGPRTRMLSVSAVEFASGVKTDLQALGSLCKERGVLFCVDGIQQVGAFPVDVDAAQIDFLSADSHKWMLGLPGIGFIFVRTSLLTRLRPVTVGWKSIKNALDFDHLQFDLREDAAKFEEGTPSFINTLGLGAALALLLEVGIPTIANHITNWLTEADQALTRRGLTPGPEPGRRAGILTFQPPSGTAEEFVARALAASVHVSARRGRVRISPHLYSGEPELSALLQLL
jgi:selenocysteine lyase/cysteine desulfurase